jgi:hypothetical protein
MEEEFKENGILLFNCLTPLYSDDVHEPLSLAIMAPSFELAYCKNNEYDLDYLVRPVH